MSREDAAARWFVRISGGPDSEIRLLCFPHAGAGAATFNAWRAFLPPEIEVVAARLPGRESRIKEPAFTEFSTLVATLVPLVGTAFDDEKPLLLFGHCVGALIGYGLAVALEAHGRSVGALCVSGNGSLRDLYGRFSRSEDVNRAAIRSFFENGLAHTKDESNPTHKTRDETQLMAAHSVAAEDGSFRGTSDTWRRSSA